MAAEGALHEADVARLLAENERVFREAQLAADTVFAHYQLSQILASHEAPAALGGAILDELIHLCAADAGALWIYDPRSARPVLAARRGGLGSLTEDSGGSESDVSAESAEGAGTDWTSVPLDDGNRRVGLVALRSGDGGALEPFGVRFLSHVRHELAVALRGAQLRESLELERGELSAIFEGASDAIVLVDGERRVVRINDAAGTLLGESTAKAVGRTCDDLLACRAPGSGDPCHAGCPFAQVIASGEPVRGYERTLGSWLPDPVHVVGNYALASRSAGGAALAVAIFRDTTQMAQLDELRRGFVATVSHELRTPLALIKGYVDTLLHLEIDPGTARRYLERIDETTGHLSQLVRQTLDVTQLAIGRLVLERSTLLLPDLIGAAVDDLHLHRPELVIELRLDGALPPVDVDPGRIRQVLDNLIGNASKYGPPEGPVRITATCTSGWVAVTVEDNGVGVPSDERELVFEQFHRGRNVRESTLAGYGLGLSISRRIVEAHGGELNLDPDRSVGTAVVMRLPAGVPLTASTPSTEMRR